MLPAGRSSGASESISASRAPVLRSADPQAQDATLGRTSERRFRRRQLQEASEDGNRATGGTRQHYDSLDSRFTASELGPDGRWIGPIGTDGRVADNAGTGTKYEEVGGGFSEYE